ncbi:unnamed protein product [Arctogadus glacialis]
MSLVCPSATGLWDTAMEQVCDVCQCVRQRLASGPSDGAGTMEQVRWSRYDGAGTMEQVRWSRYDGAGTMEQREVEESGGVTPAAAWGRGC